MKIKYYQIDKEFLRIHKNAINAFKNIGKNGNYILGSHLKKFENKISKLIKCKHVAGVGNGTDALELALSAHEVKKGTEIITTSNTFISTVNAIINYGCIPVFVDVDETQNINVDIIENYITKKTSAIIPVHLNGMPACLKKVNQIAKKNKIVVIEDCAQSILSEYDGNKIGNSKNICCFSLHPTKNLGGVGDGGFITTNNENLFNKIIKLRNHGLASRSNVDLPGRNSRLDEINAAILNLKLKFLKSDTNKKIHIAKRYDKYLTNMILKPDYGCCKKIKHTYHRYVIRVAKNRNKFLKYLNKKDIEFKIHYEKNIHQQKYFKKFLKKNQKLKNTDKFAKQVVSLPINQFLNFRETDYIISSINKYFEKS